MPRKPSLAQFVLLSMALHALAILLFGSPAGGSPEGQAMWGSLDVTIRGPLLEGASLPASRESRERPVAPAPRPVPTPAPPPPAPPPPAPPPQVALPPDVPTPALATPQVAPAEADLASVPGLTPIVPPVPVVSAPPIDWTPQPSATPRTEAMTAVPAIEAPPKPIELPVVSTPLLAPPTESRTTPALAPPVAIVVPPRPVAPVEVPAPLQPRTAPVPAVPDLVAPVQVAAPPRRVKPVEVPTPLQPRTAPAPVTPELAAPVEIAAPPPPRELPTIAAPPIAGSATPPSEGAPVPALAEPVRIAPPPPRPLEPLAVPAPLAEPVGTPAASPELAPPAPVVAPPAPKLAPRNELAPGRASPRDDATGIPEGKPDSPIFRRNPPPAELPRGSGPTIDMDAARARARQMAREGMGNRAILPFPMPPVPRKKSKEEIAIENARKPDCREAYKALGLLAVVPLIANEFGEGNCRW